MCSGGGPGAAAAHEGGGESSVRRLVSRAGPAKIPSAGDADYCDPYTYLATTGRSETVPDKKMLSKKAKQCVETAKRRVHAAEAFPKMVISKTVNKDPASPSPPRPPSPPPYVREDAQEPRMNEVPAIQTVSSKETI